MLKGIPPILSPELLLLIAEMGHGDELVLADANFPAAGIARRLVRADGHSASAMLEAVLSLLPLDSFVEQPAAVMRRVDRPDEAASIWHKFQEILDRAEGRAVGIERVERFAFYERARAAFGVVATGETALYGNLILKKGVIEPRAQEASSIEPPAAARGGRRATKKQQLRNGKAADLQGM